MITVLLSLKSKGWCYRAKCYFWLGGLESPGPEKTENPWDSVAASRRSSISSVKPEVLVTTIPSVDKEDEDRASAGSEKMTMSRLMTLLPVSQKCTF